MRTPPFLNRFALNIAIAAVFTGIIVWEGKRIADLQHELKDMSEKMREMQGEAEKNMVNQRISEQLEEIAYEQMNVSDAEREKAKEQATIAENMRLQAESEQRKAQDSEEKARTALTQAEKARQLAEKQRRDAEDARDAEVLAKDETNKLRMIALGRSLGTLAVNQFHANNKELARTIAYASWLFTWENGGDPYTPEIFEALTLVSGGMGSSKEHQAGVTSIKVFEKNTKTETVVSCGKYGEIVSEDVLKASNKVVSRETLFSDKAFDFRHLYIDGEHNIYALSKDGRVVKISSAGIHKILDKCPEALANHFTTVEKKVINTHLNLMAEGSKSGDIILVNAGSGEVKRLLGHSSAVTGLVFVGNWLYSCSLDGTLKLWNVSSAVPNPVTLLDTGVWILDMEKSHDSELLWLGGGDGTIRTVMIQADKLAERLKQQMKRNLTRSEWNEYIGEDVPYRERL